MLYLSLVTLIHIILCLVSTQISKRENKESRTKEKEKKSLFDFSRVFLILYLRYGPVVLTPKKTHILLIMKRI